MNHKNIINKKLTLLLVLLWITTFGGIGSNVSGKLPGYPIPPKTEKLMFYIQRSMNANTIAYEINVDENNQLNKDQPIHPYWIRYEEDGSNKELSQIERKFAYGVNSEPKHNQEEEFALSLVSYPLDIILRKNEQGKYCTYITVNEKDIMLSNIYFQTEGGTFWKPNVKYIDIFGIDRISGLNVVERIIP